MTQIKHFLKNFLWMFLRFIFKGKWCGLYKFEIEKDLIDLLPFGEIDGVPSHKSFNPFFEISIIPETPQVPSENHTN